MTQGIARSEMIESARPSSVAAYDFSVARLSNEAWSPILSQFADATLYQSHAYGAVRWGEKRLLHAVLRFDGQIVAATQIILAGVPGMRVGVAYAPSGPLWRSRGTAPNPTHLQVLVDRLSNEFVRRRGLYLRLSPVEVTDNIGTVQACLQARGFATSDENRRQTIYVDLEQEVKTLEAQCTKKWRENLRRSLRSDLVIKEGIDDAMYGVFASLYSEMHSRKQFTQNVSVPEFREIQKRLPLDQKMQVMICERHGIPVAGLVWSSIGEMGIPIFSGTGDEGLKYRGSYLLRWNMALRMKEKGCRLLDQGGVNPEKNPGGYHFKSGMGGRLVQEIGHLDRCTNPISRLAVAGREWWQGQKRRWAATAATKAAQREAASVPEVVEPPASSPTSPAVVDAENPKQASIQ